MRTAYQQKKTGRMQARHLPFAARLTNWLDADSAEEMGVSRMPARGAMIQLVNGNGGRSLCTAHGYLSMRTRLCRLGRSGAQTTLIRWQRAARQGLQGRTGRHPPAAYHWRNDTHCLDRPQTLSGRFMNGSHVEAPTNDACRNRTGKQNGADHLGHSDKGRRLSRSGKDCGCLRIEGGAI